MPSEPGWTGRRSLLGGERGRAGGERVGIRCRHEHVVDKPLELGARRRREHALDALVKLLDAESAARHRVAEKFGGALALRI